MQFSPNNHREAGQSVLMSSMRGLANTGAAVATFLLSPLLYGSTVAWMQKFTAQNYGYGFDDLVAFLWFVVTACLVFFVARASLGTLLVMGGLAIAVRFL